MWQRVECGQNLSMLVADVWVRQIMDLRITVVTYITSHESFEFFNHSLRN